ncbi:hypothetical protein JQX13_44445 [Archangium violaceum]|uniref:hypothetical protein n=1 Tax=Archangium violaceum TaxID=83451 RepID=UPI00193C12CA|nr:hypothetical protein [Archangium violaceum]QRK07036.1 hypothetical protein JQX13_44445 [Archangium violaceum]
MVTDPYRDHCKRQHRILAHHLCLEAWRAGDDGILLERHHLEEFLKIERFKSSRVQWLLEDLEPWFKYIYPVYSESALESLQALYLSRVPIDEKFIIKNDDVSVEDLVGWMRNNGVRISLLYSISTLVPLTEEQIVPRLALLATGLAEP